jgi:hypothetical protein
VLLPANTQLLKSNPTCSGVAAATGCVLSCTDGFFKPAESTYKLKCVSAQWTYVVTTSGGDVGSSKAALGENYLLGYMHLLSV